MSKAIKVSVELTEERAAALALFLKRLMLDDFTGKCGPHEQARALHYTMQSAAFDLGNALAEQGFNPR
jgi:hypothetical protein